MDDPVLGLQDSSQAKIGEGSRQGHPTFFSQSPFSSQHSQSPFSSQQPMTPSEYHHEVNEGVDAQHIQRLIQPAPTTGTKKRGAKNQTKKGKKDKPIVDVSDDEDVDEGKGAKSWTDPEVIQLIAFRSEMDVDFKHNAKKQGINSWEKLQGRMVAACDNFCKSSEACRKKWKVVYNQYCNDKRLLQISGEGRKIACRFFDEIDEGFNNAANVKKFCHGDARGFPNPCPPDLSDPGEEQAPGEGQDSANAALGGENAGMSKEASPQGSEAAKKTYVEQISSFMGNMVNHSADMANSSRHMVTQTTRIADDIHQNGTLLKELQSQMGKLIDKL